MPKISRSYSLRLWKHLLMNLKVFNSQVSTLRQYVELLHKDSYRINALNLTIALPQRKCNISEYKSLL